jgi:hypothetical protein
VGDLIARLLTRWRAASVTPNPGVSEAELSAFEAANRVRLPDDLRQFLRAANGIPFSELDGLARLRPIADYFRVVDRVPAALSQAAGSDDPGRYYCFGDYNIEGSFWGIRLAHDPVLPAPVRVFWHDGGGYVVAASFREFLDRYLSEEPDGMC